MILDAKGKPCPQPVVLALHALTRIGTGETLAVLVDNEAAVENLKRMAAQKGYTAAVETTEGGWQVTLSSTAGGAAPSMPAQPLSCGTEFTENTAGGVVAIGTDVMGKGSEELGHILMKSFLYALAQLENPPRTLVFFNGGARLTTKGSAALEDLKALENAGTEILTCGTCLDYYGIKDNLAVGSVTNMYRIAELLTGPGRVIGL